jgi:hypothetical protein
MNSLIKLTVAALAIATLAGCASIPQAPKNAQEMAEMAEIGDDNLLNVPVDITGFSWKKQEIVAVNGDKGIVTVFTDPKTSLTYDTAGQPVNEKAERVLRNGIICKVKEISSTFHSRIYDVDSDIILNCTSKERLESMGITIKSTVIAFTGGMALGAAGVGIAAGTLATTTATPLIDAATNDTSGDTH